MIFGWGRLSPWTPWSRRTTGEPTPAKRLSRVNDDRTNMSEEPVGKIVVNKTKATRTVAVVNREGFHLRAAMLLIALARQFDSDIAIAKGSFRADAKSTPLQLLGLGAYQGDRVIIEAVGDDAHDAVDAMAELFASHFSEEAAKRRPVKREPMPEQCLEGEPSAE
jgi:phosphotransferase system HPr (HPr) family protein